MAEFNLERAKSALRNADAAGDAAAAKKIANGIKQYMQSSQSSGPVLAHEKVIGGRVADMGTMGKIGLGAATGLSKIGSGVANLLAESSPSARLRQGLNFVGDTFNIESANKAAELLPQKPEFLNEWQANNDLRSVAVNEAGAPAQLTEFGVSLVPEVATALATRGTGPLLGGAKGPGMFKRAGAQGTTAYATTDGDTIDRSIAGAASGVGYGAGAGSIRTGRAANDAWRNVKDLYSANGQKRNVRRLLENYSSAPNLLLGRIDNAAAAPLPGYKRTLAETVPKDKGLSQLQRASLTNNKTFLDRAAFLRDKQNDTIVSAFDNAAGRNVNPKTNISDYDAAVQNRAINAQRNYGKAENTPLQLSPSATKRAGQLLQRPYISQAVTQAKSSAKSRGKVMKPEGSIEGLQQVRDALSKKLKTATGAKDPDKNVIEDVKSELKALDSFLARVSPDFAKAQRTFKDDSVDVNRMNIMNLLREKLVPAMYDAGRQAGDDAAPTKLNAEMLMRALRDKNSRSMDESRRIVKDSTGLNKTLDEVLDGGRLQTLDDVINTLTTRNQTDNAFKAPGSPTAMFGSQQDIMDRILFPFMQGRGAIPLSRVIGDFYASKHNKAVDIVQAKVAKALADPNYAKRMLKTPIPQDWVNQANKNPDLLMRLLKQKMNKNSANGVELGTALGLGTAASGLEHYIMEN